MSQTTNYRSLLTQAWCFAQEICKNTGMEGGTKMSYFYRSNEHFRYLILYVSLICTLALMLSPAPVVWKSLMSWPIMCSRPYPRIFSAVWLHHTTCSTTNIFFHQPKYFLVEYFSGQKTQTDQEDIREVHTRRKRRQKWWTKHTKDSPWMDWNVWEVLRQQGQRLGGCTLCLLSVIWTMSVQLSSAENKPSAARNLSANIFSLEKIFLSLECSHLAAALTGPWTSWMTSLLQ